MATPVDPDELALVVKAITCGTTGCCLWDDDAQDRFRSAPPIRRLTPKSVFELLHRCVSGGEPVIQVVEQREHWKKRRYFNRFYYKVILPIPELTGGLFVELVLTDDDPDVPSVSIVNAHEQLP